MTLRVHKNEGYKLITRFGNREVMDDFTRMISEEWWGQNPREWIRKRFKDEQVEAEYIQRYWSVSSSRETVKVGSRGRRHETWGQDIFYLCGLRWEILNILWLWEWSSREEKIVNAMDWMCASLQKSYVETIIPNIIAFGGGPFGRC